MLSNPSFSWRHRLAVFAAWTLTALALLVSVSTAHAAAQGQLVLKRDSGTIATLPVVGGITIDAAGNVLMNCDKVGPEHTCPSLFNNTAQPPQTYFLASPTQLKVGETLGLSWSSAAADICLGTTTTSAVAWHNLPLGKSGYRAIVTLPVGDYVFNVRCYSTGGVTQVATPTIRVLAQTGPVPDPPSGYCQTFYPTPPSSPNFTALGLTRVSVEFEQVFGTYPGGGAPLRPIVRDHLPLGNTYLAIPFIMAHDTGADAQMTVDFGLAQGDAGPSGALLFTISPCAGDFRPRDPAGNNASDVYVRNICRMEFRRNNGKFNISSRPADAAAGYCPAPKGKLMFLNISTHNLYASTPGASSCTTAPCGLVFQIL